MRFIREGREVGLSGRGVPRFVHLHQSTLLHQPDLELRVLRQHAGQETCLARFPFPDYANGGSLLDVHYQRMFLTSVMTKSLKVQNERLTKRLNCIIPGKDGHDVPFLNTQGWQAGLDVLDKWHGGGHR